MEDPRPVNVRGQITELDGQKFIVQTKEDVKGQYYFVITWKRRVPISLMQ